MHNRGNINYYELKIEGKDVKRFIKQLYNLGIYFEEIKFIDKIVYVKIDSNNYKKLSKVKTIYKIYTPDSLGYASFQHRFLLLKDQVFSNI